MGILEAVLVGLLAGFIGTIVMTVSETVEMRLTGRPPSTVPGQVGAKTLGRDPNRVAHLERLSTGVHWLHGTSMGALRGLLALTGLGAVAATVVHYALVWGGDAATYRALGIAPAPWRWGAGELVTDLFHKGIYAVATGVAFVLLAGLI